MDYEEAYKHALARASKLRVQNPFNTVSQMMEYVFPGLKESEDEFIEKIRKNIISYLNNRQITSIAESSATERWISWLEKKGEQKTTDKVGPKFKVGDWITNGYCKYQITFIDSRYWYSETRVLGDVESIDEKYHLWSIADAKDGDVLVYGNNPADHHLRIIMLFKSMRTFNSAFNHFHIFDDEFRINDWCDCGKTAHPATKEQRDLLFQKMKEAGYEWDEEKKQLKRVEKQSEQNSPILSNSSNIGKYFIAPEESLGISSDKYNEVVSDCIFGEQGEQKWTEEDDYNVQCCIAKAESDIANGCPGRNKELIDWLKSLKQRMERQQL